jgi:DNA-binding MarR family transcriptional regulator
MARRPDDARMGAWRAFLRAYASVTDVLERELVEAKALPLTWYDVLLQLSEAPTGRLRMQELARSVLLSKSGLTRVVDRMTADGLVRREAAADDARGAFACLMPAGRSALRRAAPVHLAGVHEHFARHITDAEAAALTAALDRIARAAAEAQR